MYWWMNSIHVNEYFENTLLVIDLENQVIVRDDGITILFEIDSFGRHCLFND